MNVQLSKELDNLIESQWGNVEQRESDNYVNLTALSQCAKNYGNPFSLQEWKTKVRFNPSVDDAAKMAGILRAEVFKPESVGTDKIIWGHPIIAMEYLIAHYNHHKNDKNKNKFYLHFGSRIKTGLLGNNEDVLTPQEITELYHLKHSDPPKQQKPKKKKNTNAPRVLSDYEKQVISLMNQLEQTLKGSSHSWRSISPEAVKNGAYTETQLRTQVKGILWWLSFEHSHNPLPDALKKAIADHYPEIKID